MFVLVKMKHTLFLNKHETKYLKVFWVKNEMYIYAINKHEIN